MTTNHSQCMGDVRTFLGYCDRKATIERDGKRYCWQHDPERLRRIGATRRMKQRATYAATEARIEAEVERSKLEILSGIRELTNDDLARITAVGGIFKLLPWCKNTD